MDRGYHALDGTNQASENIELALPLNPAYVSAARLTASSIANRMGFDIEYIEDIKSAVSEACTFIIKKNSHTAVHTFKIQFELLNDKLEILLICANGQEDLTSKDDTEMSLIMIKALMDNVEILNHEGSDFKIVMTKNL